MVKLNRRVRSGYININNGRLRYSGNSGGKWSSQTSDTAHAYRLNFNASTIYSAAGDSRDHAVPLRCLARQ